jgi:drug/metabolite transporter (DMT)-like permease
MGEAAALATALLWACTSLFFTASAERIGAARLNLVRLTFALAFIAAGHQLLFGTLHFAASPTQLIYLAVSGAIGLVVGDLFLFRALILIGPRATLLIMTLWPAIAATIAWLWLGERLGALSLAGMAVTLGGIAWSIAGRAAGPDRRPLSIAGIGCGLAGALGQATALALAKRGLDGMDSELSGSFVRMAAAVALVWNVSLVQGAMGRLDLLGALRNGRAMVLAAAGALTGPTIGVWLSLVAATHGSLGVVATLMSLSTVFVIPLSAWFRRERPTIHEWLGAVVAVAGVALLLSPTL